MKENNKHRQNILLFLSTPEIKEWINKIRNYLEIPEEIFYEKPAGGINQLLEDWNNKIYDKTDEIMESSDFKKGLSEIKEKFRQEEITHSEAEEMNKELHLKLPINYLTNAIKELVSKYNLPKFYEYPIRGYIETGQVHFIGTGPYGIRPNYLNNKEDNTLDIIVNEPLTDENLIEIKERVNNHFKKRGPKTIKNIKDIEMRLDIEEKYNNREYIDPNNPEEKFKSSAQEIADLINDEYKTEVSAGDVYETSKQLEKIRKRRFGTK